MHDKAFTFQTLRPDTIIDGLFDLGMRVDSGLTPLNSYENRVYQFQDEERHRYVVKFYRPERWSAAQILEEHQFALQLVEDEVPVAAPLLFNDSTLHQHQGFYFAVFPSLGGRQFEADNLDQMEWVGRYLGRLHQTGRKQRFSARPEIGVQEYLLEPVLGIHDPRTDDRIDFVGGIRGLEELEKRTQTDMKVAFAMYPTSIAELFAVADAGLLMPPKSTWFEPKLRSGLFIHEI